MLVTAKKSMTKNVRGKSEPWSYLLYIHDILIVLKASRPVQSRNWWIRNETRRSEEQRRPFVGVTRESILPTSVALSSRLPLLSYVICSYGNMNNFDSQTVAMNQQSLKPVLGYEYHYGIPHTHFCFKLPNYELRVFFGCRMPQTTFKNSVVP